MNLGLPQPPLDDTLLRRRKTAYLPVDVIEWLFQQHTNTWLMFGGLEGIDLQSLRIMTVNFSQERNAFRVYFLHPDFPIVRDGLEPPELILTMHAHRVEEVPQSLPPSPTNKVPRRIRLVPRK